MVITVVGRIGIVVVRTRHTDTFVSAVRIVSSHDDATIGDIVPARIALERPVWQDVCAALRLLIQRAVQRSDGVTTAADLIFGIANPSRKVIQSRRIRFLSHITFYRVNGAGQSRDCIALADQRFTLISNGVLQRLQRRGVCLFRHIGLRRSQIVL